ncbi:MAG: phytanoyl-CoA dioxygenase family protein [Marivibrio sp.]|uniref:phytanoyl-CoA dioxygenase family protein n=1 Tax=Marivibrio sp. TaxID=2039719 RepID=UPI0032EAE2AA
MSGLSEAQREAFRRDGYLLVADAVDADLLAALKADFAGWTAESLSHQAPFGETINGKPRFDLDPDHSPARSGLRRVNAPVEVSHAYYRAMAESRMTRLVADLIGPNVTFHHSKINAKLPGAKTEVKWHQDFLFTPHSNDDVVTALLMVDDVTDENGPLEVVPGSHRGPLHGLWRDGRFVGAVEDAVAEEAAGRAVRCAGPAGSVCLMHTRLLHGSAPNLSSAPRTLFICVYSAEDARPLSPNPMPNGYEGLLVAGERTGRIRSIPFEMQAPELPSTASFFDQQTAVEA